MLSQIGTPASPPSAFGSVVALAALAAAGARATHAPLAAPASAQQKRIAWVHMLYGQGCALDTLRLSRSDIETALEPDGLNLMHVAAARGDVEALDFIANHPESVDMSMRVNPVGLRGGYGIAHLATHGGNVRVIDWLGRGGSRGARPELREQLNAPIAGAVLRNARGVVQGNVEGITPLGMTVGLSAAGQPELETLIAQLLRSGANARLEMGPGPHQGRTVAHMAAAQAAADVLKFIGRHDPGALSIPMGGEGAHKGLRPVHMAAQLGDAKKAGSVFNALSAAGVSLDQPAGAGRGQGMTAAHVACTSPTMWMLDVLRRAGASLDTPAAAGSIEGLTPLQLDAVADKGDRVAWLCQHGCQVDRVIEAGPDAGMTALDLACERGAETAIKALTLHNADRFRRIESGWAKGMQPMHIAVSGGHIGAVEMLTAPMSRANKIRAWSEPVVAQGMPTLNAVAIAAHQGEVDMLKLALKQGVNLCQVSESGPNEGMTAVFAAAAAGREAVIDFFKNEFGAEPVSGAVKSGPNHGAAPFHLALAYGHDALALKLYAGESLYVQLWGQTISLWETLRQHGRTDTMDAIVRYHAAHSQAGAEVGPYVAPLDEDDAESPAAAAPRARQDHATTTQAPSPREAQAAEPVDEPARAKVTSFGPPRSLSTLKPGPQADDARRLSRNGDLDRLKAQWSDNVRAQGAPRKDFLKLLQDTGWTMRGRPKGSHATYVYGPTVGGGHITVVQTAEKVHPRTVHDALAIMGWR